MVTTTEELMTIIETLPIEIRIELIEKLLNSLNFPQKEIDRLWVEEAERRLREIENGEVGTVSIEKVFKKIFEKYSE